MPFELSRELQKPSDGLETVDPLLTMSSWGQTVATAGKRFGLMRGFWRLSCDDPLRAVATAGLHKGSIFTPGALAAYFTMWISLTARLG